jgi:hypothetical protein
MKTIFRSLAILALTSLTCRADGPEPFQPEEAQRIAHKLNDAIGNPSDAPFTTEVDPDKPQGFKAGGAGVMVLPDRKLTADALEHAGKTITPIGQLWTLDISVAPSGRPIANSQVRLVRVGDGDKSREVQLYYLGAAKNDAGALQLVIFAKDKSQPVHRIDLTKTTGTSQSAPIELDGRKQDEKTGILTLRLLGEYSAEVLMTKAD